MATDILNYARFWGVRGSYPSPFGSHLRVGGNTSCVELRVDNHILICDGGSGIIPLGNALMTQQAIREVTIIVTHYHWDHISGLPFFVPAFVPGWKVNIFGPGNSEKDVERHIARQMIDPYFPVEVETWLADVRYLTADKGRLQYGPFEIETFYVHHPGITFGYRIKVHDKIIVYVSDNELAFMDRSIQSRRSELSVKELELVDAMQIEEHNKSLDSVSSAHIFIHDSQYTTEDYAKKRGWGHSCYVDTVNFAVDAKVKQLFLFHVDPNYPDNKIEELHHSCVKIIHERHSTMECHIAREGLIIDIDAL